MDNDDSFLHIEEDDKKKLLLIRKALFNTLVRNAKSEERKGMYLVSLAIFSEFERLTKHITDPEIIKS
jgi:hypothetical protein